MNNTKWLFKPAFVLYRPCVDTHALLHIPTRIYIARVYKNVGEDTWTAFSRQIGAASERVFATPEEGKAYIDALLTLEGLI